jgi:hypothetical protein
MAGRKWVWWGDEVRRGDGERLERVRHINSQRPTASTKQFGNFQVWVWGKGFK